MTDKRLVRATDDRMVAGVAAGVAQYLNVDTTLVRLIFVLLALGGGHGLLAYFVLWFIMPEA
ncbi:MAG: PspC domain-containing protein [Chloroflexota bacterium]|nr:PspC domain-containing protein [Ardenticatenaceae bacterium]MCB8992284.1 PspC domain-containing protein [Ardenticatenaceae bacterium]